LEFGERREKKKCEKMKRNMAKQQGEMQREKGRGIVE
jgi:hypothetical protein